MTTYKEFLREEHEREAKEREKREKPLRELSNTNRRLEMAIDTATALTAPDEVPEDLKRFSDYRRFYDEVELRKVAQASFDEMNERRVAAGKLAITLEQFKAIGEFAIAHDLFPDVTNLEYSVKRVLGRLKKVQAKYAPPEPSSQELLQQKYREVDAEQPPEGLNRQQLLTWEKRKLQRLIEVESATCFDQTAADVGVYVGKEERQALWNKARGTVVNRVTILKLLKAGPRTPDEIKRIDAALEQAARDAVYVGTGGYTDESGKVVHVR